jgi:hypothetical protein
MGVVTYNLILGLKHDRSNKNYGWSWWDIIPITGCWRTRSPVKTNKNCSGNSSITVLVTSPWCCSCFFCTCFIAENPSVLGASAHDILGQLYLGSIWLIYIYKVILEYIDRTWWIWTCHWHVYLKIIHKIEKYVWTSLKIPNILST